MPTKNGSADAIYPTQYQENMALAIASFIASLLSQECRRVAFVQQAWFLFWIVYSALIQSRWNRSVNYGESRYQ